MGDDNGFGDWGGYMEAKKAKLMEQYDKEKKEFQKDALFQGISVFVNGRTDPPANDIKRIMIEHGGVYHHYERHDTKFIIASNLCDVKVRNSSTAKIIGPEWITDCLKANRILDYTNYLLYTDRDSKQPKIKTFAVVVERAQNETLTADSSDTSQMFKNLTELSRSLNSAYVAENDDSGILLESKETGNITAEPKTSAIVEETDNETKSSSLANSNLFDETKDESIEIKQQPLNISKTFGNKTNNNVARTAVDPLFLNEFFNNSRLHHIATLGASFKKFICDLRENNKSPSFPQRQVLKERLLNEGVSKLENNITQCVMHIDMDCFFVSVGLRDNPELKDKPVAVTHSKGGAQATDVPVHPNANRAVEKELFAKKFEQHLHNNILADKVKGGFENKLSLSEIASCSYAARQKGIKNGMFVGEALVLCPDLITIPYNFDGYKEVSTSLYQTLTEYTFNIEAVSCDEMFVDLVDIINEMQVPVMAFVKAIRDIVFERTRCTCSAGIGVNKFQARMSTKEAKPNGQFYLHEDDVLSFIEHIPIKELPGVGYSINHTLKSNNLITCGDLHKIPKTRLQSLVGQKLGEKLFNFARGIDSRPLEYEHIRKSVSAEVNYGIRFQNVDETERFLRQLCGEVHRRLLEVNRSTKSITLKVMVRAKEAPIETSKFMGHGVCDNSTKTAKLNKPTQSVDTITQNVITMMKSLAIPPQELRGIGITLANLDKPEDESNRNNSLKNMFAKIVLKNVKNKDHPNPLDASVNIIKEESSEVIDQEKSESKDPKMLKVKDVEKKIKPEVNSVAGKESKKSSTIITMFNAAAEKMEKQKEAQFHLPSHIDPEVFAALPEDIKQEILESFHKDDFTNLDKPNGEVVPPLVEAEAPFTERNAEVASTSSISTLETAVDNNCKSLFDPPTNVAVNLSTKPIVIYSTDVDDQPSTSKAAAERRLLKNGRNAPGEEVEENLSTSLPPSNRENKERSTSIDAGSMGSNLDENELKGNINSNENNDWDLKQNKIRNVITMEGLSCWVEDYVEPDIIDIKVFSDYCFFLIEENDISELFDKLVHMCRVIMQVRENSCAWHTAFRVIFTLVQGYMVNVNQKKLFFTLDINCDNCSTLLVEETILWLKVKTAMN